MNKSELKSFLDFKVVQYNTPEFIATDPIQIPHRFSIKEDIEISGFLTATIAWGNRKSILTNAGKMMDLMDSSPYDFVMNHEEKDLEEIQNFVHRTFNSGDLRYFIRSLQNIYKNHNGLESVFTKNADKDSLQRAIHEFKSLFFELPHEKRTEKHVSDPLKNSAAKRINMFLRWMVRNDNTGVDFGIWKKLSPAQLSCPLDVHSGKVARKLKLLKRKANDATALNELDTNLRKLDPIDPVKYDFALFGLGVFEKGEF
ncbi:TIGR02757 family protein [Christiangramia salexigens]|uniref:TIGR02757 family protein n=1 Tax=Christiangramia salexigens TaxID=1913577 RepID=A0A1L3J3H2_9FLAO|nr:TIGR02757 family protein [Christiangramia salexigens]APG59666.1 TIGR02757 family protein [Christiangramia salexigens]